MERAPGVELGQKWEGLRARDQLSIVKQLATIACTLARSQFPCHGSLYRRQDVTLSESIFIDDEFPIGPTIGRALFDKRRGEIDVPRGPWTSADNLMKALVQREAAYLEEFPSFPQALPAQGLFGGPGGYHPTKEAKLSVLQDFLKICPHIIPRDEKVLTGVIWHNDLHVDNIRRYRGPISDHKHYRLASRAYFPMFLICLGVSDRPHIYYLVTAEL
ncbi:hypothetical protein MAP00_000159 [Monascus purpureus]|nr:hypothetical protein MAP00_000159 [Monascus purpureus]